LNIAQYDPIQKIRLIKLLNHAAKSLLILLQLFGINWKIPI